MATYTIIKDILIKEIIEVELPYYSKSISYAYKVIDSKRAIDVCYSSSDYGIKENRASLAFSDSCQPCTEEEFNKLFTETLNKLKFLNS